MSRKRFRSFQSPSSNREVTVLVTAAGVPHTFLESQSTREHSMNPTPIFECFTAYQKTAAMQAAVDIGLFSAIAAGSSITPEIARACGASAKGVRVLCDYWAVQGLLIKEG